MRYMKYDLNELPHEHRNPSKRCHLTPQPELAEILGQAIPDGFSLEWVFDRYEQQNNFGGAHI